jgi:predicted nuclease of predicted toxin-antitoxin system
MPDQPLQVLLDQNIPEEITAWLRVRQSTWQVTHVKEAKLDGRPDSEIFRWAQSRHAIVITYDEDFADARSFSLGSHYGIVRLRVWPTTAEQTQNALERLMAQVPLSDIPGSLIIIDNQKIRLRRKP